MSEIVEASFRIVTPMFLGGADQSVRDGIRPPSVKGALRFWWRALNWAKFRQTTTCDEASLVLLHDEEIRLFGGSSEQGGQGCFLLSVSASPRPGQAIRDWPANNTGAGYLAFGIVESGSPAKGNYQSHREAMKEGAAFRLRLVFRPRTCARDIESIRTAMNAWGLFGGLGSRSRRGMGSVTQLGDQDALPSRTEYEVDANAFLAERSGVGSAPYTAFSRDSRFRILCSGEDARTVLGNAGQRYKDFRGQASSLRGADKIPFGLPLQGVDDKSRRASPLLFHVHAVAGAQYVATVLYLPASVFHPEHPDVSNARVAEFATGAKT